MKTIITLFLCLFMQAVYSEVNQYGSAKSDKLYITAKTHDNKPASWLKYYKINIPPGTEHEKRIVISAYFNIKNVTDMIISDVNASSNKCGKNKEKDILYLSLNPKKNFNKITTRIHLPCLVKNKAILKIAVKTSTGKRFYNTTILTAHPDAFNTVYTD